MLMIAGVLDICRGVMALAEDDVFVSTRDHVFGFDLTGWGWIHLARVAIAGLVIVANFLSLPYYPVWPIVMIAFQGFIIWTL